MQDSAGAEKWISGLPNSSSRDAAVASYIGVLAATAPERATPWIEEVKDSSARLESITTVAQQWLQSDRSSAEAWLAKMNLPAETKNQILHSTEQPSEPADVTK
jgi:ABC-type proline/glycine betaine transport system substrate-binding protein